MCLDLQNLTNIMSTLKVNAIRGTGASSDAISVNSTDGTCTAKITNPPLGSRRLSINGAMNVAQRKTAADAEANGYATVDRYGWFGANVVGSASTQQQGTNAPDGFKKCYRIDVTTAVTSLATNAYSPIYHAIESKDCTYLAAGTSAAKSITISFWVRTNKTGNYCLNVKRHDASRHITSAYTVSSADTWEKKVITFPGDTSGNQFNDDNGHGLLFYWHLSSGTGYTSVDSTSWGTASNEGFCYGQTVNIFDSTSNYFELTGVQVEASDHATDFEHRSYSDELARCQRYYYDHLGGFPEDETPYGVGSVYNSGYVFSYIPFKVQMRAKPTLESNDNANSHDVLIGATAHASSKNVLTNAGTSSALIYPWVGTISVTAGDCGILRTASTSNCKLRFSAEL